MKKNVQDLEMTIKKQEAERQSKEHQVRSLQEEIQAQDDAIAKANKERKQQEEVCWVLKLFITVVFRSIAVFKMILPPNKTNSLT